MNAHNNGTREEWLKARLDLLKGEKELTHHSDEVARLRQELPWVPINKGYRFDTDEGASLADLFRGRSQLLIYHFMFGPDFAAGCPSCSSIADGFNGIPAHLASHDVMLWAVSRAPFRSYRPTSAGWVGRSLGRLPSVATSISISTSRSPASNCARGPNTTSAATTR
jgi:predicted dithiol-disulfide oxidoreductase (DUF899 family)